MRAFTQQAACALSISLCLSSFSIPECADPAESYVFSSKRPDIEKDKKFVEDEIIAVTDVSADEESLQMEIWCIIRKY